MPLQIRVSRNFRGNKHIPADGVTGNVRATYPGKSVPSVPREERAGRRAAGEEIRPKTTRFCQNL